MADKRHLSRASYGFPGLLAYRPARSQGDVEEGGEGAADHAELGTLECHRFDSQLPRFKIIGPLKTLYTASIPQTQEASSRLWWERRGQTRWLFRKCPDAFVGTQLFRDVFKEDAKSNRGSHQQMMAGRPLLTVGQLPPQSDDEAAQRIMAVPAGESGQLLRLARMGDSQWQWADSRDAFINISTVDPSRQESEAIWEDDGLPIIQLKWATDGLEDGTEEWLLVQKETSTALLRPGSHEIASPTAKSEGLSADAQPPLITPSPVLIIRHRQTGDRAHADVVLIPASRDRPPQLAIIDDCGYWIIWDLIMTEQAHRRDTSLKFFCCGHIADGPLNRIPLTTPYTSRPHGLLLVAPETGRPMKEESPSPDQKRDLSPMRSYLVMWNEEQVTILDIETKVMLPELGRLQTDLWKQDPVLDIQRDPLHRNLILILTKRSLMWVDTLGPQASVGKVPVPPAILLHCTHLGTVRDDSRMFACRASDEDPDTICAFVYYPKMRQMCVFWLRFSHHASIPQWHRDTVSLPGDDELYAGRSVKSMMVDQAQLVLSTKPNARSPGIDYDRDGALFYQLSILWDDLSLRNCMCAISIKPGLMIDAPDTLVDWLEPRNLVPVRRRRERDCGSRFFILPDLDPLSEEASGSFSTKKKEKEEEEEEDGTSSQGAAKPGRNPRDSRPATVKFDKICGAVQDAIEETMAHDDFGLPTTLFAFLRDTLSEEQGYERLPLLTWREIAEQVSDLGDSMSVEMNTEQAIQELFEQNGEHKVFAELRSIRPEEVPRAPVDLPLLCEQYSKLWLDPVEGRLPDETQRCRQRLVSEVARDEFLSSYGVMIQDTPLLGPQRSEAAGMDDSQMTGIYQWSSQSRRISLSSPGIMSSSPPRPPAAPPPSSLPSSLPSASPSSSSSAAADGAVLRLSMLCSGLDADKLDVSKRSQIVSYWPAERGADPAEYMSTIVRANEELLRGARERLQRMVARRKARADKYKYKRPAFMRQGLPDLLDDGGSSGAAAGAGARARARGGWESNRSMMAGEQQQQQPSPFKQSPVKGSPVKVAMSSQRWMESSQIQGVAGPSFAMSQPVAGAYGDRKKVKKVKRKSGFR